MSENFIKKVFMSNSYFVVNKSICQILDPNSAILLSLLIDKYFYWKETGKLGADGSFYKDRHEIQNEISLTRKKRESAQKTLMHFKFLEISKITTIGYNHYLINWDNLQEAWNDPEKYRAKFIKEVDDIDPEDQNVPCDSQHDLGCDSGTNWAAVAARNVPNTKNSVQSIQTELTRFAAPGPEEEVGVLGEVESSMGLLTLKHAVMACCGDKDIPTATTLEHAIQMCKDGNVPISEMNSRDLIRLCFNPSKIKFFKQLNSGRKDKIDVEEWKGRLANLFDKLVAQIYLADTVESTVVKKAKLPEPEVSSKHGDLYISAEIANSLFDLPEDDISIMDFKIDEDEKEDDDDNEEPG